MKNGFFPVIIAGVLLSNLVAAQEDTPKFYVGAGYGVLTVPKDEDAKFSNANNGAIQFGYNLSENFAIEAHYSKSIKAASANFAAEGLDVSEAWWDATLPLNPGATLSDVQQWFPYAIADAITDIEAKVETTAIYGIYRTSGDFYVKAKAGYASTKTKATATIKSADIYVANPGNAPLTFNVTPKDKLFNDLGLNQSVNVSDNESDFSAGLGIGYKFNRKLFSELEYTKISDDFDFYSISINYAF
jgi:hypothetical protein